MIHRFLFDLRDRGRLLSARPRRHHLFTGIDRGLNAAHHKRQERSQTERTHGRDRDLHPRARKRIRQHENNEAQVHNRHTPGGKPTELLIGCAHHGGTAAHTLGKQVTHSPQKHLKQETRHENGGNLAHAKLLKRGGKHQASSPHHADNKPDKTCTHRHWWELCGTLRTKGSHHHPRHDQQPQQIHEQARAREGAHPEE